MAIFPFNLWGAGSVKTPDFDYPKTVAEDASKDLKAALKTNDGQKAIDAIIRYSIAKGLISDENMPDIIKNIENVIAKENRPQFKSLLYYFEALAFKSYSENFSFYDRDNADDETPANDYSEWDRDQFEAKVDELIGLALADVKALKQVPITSLNQIITCDKMGATYVPTLFDFLSMKCRSLTENNKLENTIEKNWMEANNDNVPAYLFAYMTSNPFGYSELYEKFKDNEHSGMLLDRATYKSDYPMLKDYIRRFPNSFYAPEVQNNINAIEKKRVDINYPEHAHSTDPITVHASVNNINAYKLNLYRVSDKIINDSKHNQRYDIDVSNLTLCESKTVNNNGVIPFEHKDTVTFGPQKYGVYVILPEFDSADGKVENVAFDMSQTITVHDLTMFLVEKDNRQCAVYVVDSKTGKPVEGATVSYEVYSDKTDKQGCFVLPEKIKNCNNIRVSNGADRYAPYMSYYSDNYGNRTDIVLKAFTDLSIYRPGETVKFSAILYQTSSDIEQHKVIPDSKVTAIFEDANGDELDTLNLVTDQYGRIQGEFKIPTGRLNGNFRIRFQNGRRGHLLSHYVNVSEYKTPTFDIIFNNDRYVFTADQPVIISGKALTYSGMPVANAEVRLTLDKDSWDWGWWRKRSKSNQHIADTLVVTNEKGEFSFEFDNNLFEEKKDRYCHNVYTLNAICTNSTGESQENSTSFIIGANRNVQFTSQEFDFINTEPLKLPLILNTTDENEKSAVCIYQVTPPDDYKNILKTGSLSTDNPVIDLTSLPSGTYKVGVKLAEEKSTYFTTATVTLYKPTDKKAPVDECPLWIPSTGRKVDAKNVAHITIGTSAPTSHIYYIASSRNKVRTEGWVTYAPGIHDFQIQIPNEPEEYITVEFFSVYQGKTYNQTVRMISEANKEQMKVKVVSFRDKLVPGTHEKWTFQLVDKKGNPRNGAMIFEMFDKALNTLSDNSWYFNPSLRSVTSYRMNTASLSGHNYIHTAWQKKNRETGDFELPELNTYDMDIFSFNHGIALLGSAAGGARYLAKSARLDDNYAVAEMEMAADHLDGAALSSELKESGVNNENLGKVQMREADVKTALWMPNLVTDDKGNVSIEFEAPNFNTTWIVQAIGYSTDLYADKLNLEMLTQKPLMVKSSLPRFLRQGDVATLAAQVQNATDKEAKCDAVIELFDPRTGDVIASRNFNETLQPMGTNPVTIDWTVPQDMPFVGFRIKAANDVFGDGEQVMLPILESISPVIETKPFFINPGDPSFNFKMPVFPKDARVTLEYCDNPVWYCVTALPTIFNNNYGISTSLAHSLYALTLAQGVAKSQPQIKEAITYWKQHNEDSTLVSMLAKNSDLKIGTLLASPWLQEADRQTLRMSKLDELFDEVKMKVEHDRIVEALHDLQMSDGGWTWYRYPECKSSLWATETILEIIGELQHLGYLTDDAAINDMVKRAMTYYDKEYLDILKERQKVDKNNYSGFSSYVYVRSFFKDIALSKENADLMKKALKAMKKDWKGLSLGEKAFFTMALNRNNEQKTAKDIVESIRQFSIVKPELGMYWDNLQVGGWYFNDKVAVTSTILQAFYEIDPRQDEIDQIRKWILLMKQSNDWGSSSLAADAVYTLLATGTQWLSRNETPAITLNGTQVEFDKVAQYLGYCRTQIPATSNAELNIDRNGNNPAWGAVYCQYKAPMDQVKEYSITELSITKEFYVYAQDGTLHTVSELKVGDKVQVRTVIKNNKDLDYVTVTDERGACFEPVDQISGHRHQDRLWYYLETKDASTNIFFDDLRKGTHVITYDVFVTAPGQYNVGIATAQCQYAPQISAHSAGRVITIKP